MQPREQERVTFDGVAGIDEAEDELVEIVDFLKNPQRYTRLRSAHSCTGCCSTARRDRRRCWRGRWRAEAHAAFFSLSASEFVEAIVGVGASRVRDLFKQAKEAAPAIVFLDELDAIGDSRSGNVTELSGGNDEREQTLKQILTEMDGFEPGTNVIVLARRTVPRSSTRRRPGRFDRRIAVNRPAARAVSRSSRSHPQREARARRRPQADRRLDPGLDRRRHRAARQRGGSLCRAAQAPAVEQRDFTDAIEKIILGAERQVVMTDADRRRTAYHGPGHALVGMLTPGADRCGRCRSSPEDRLSASPWPRRRATVTTGDELLAQIKVALGGRAAGESPSTTYRPARSRTSRTSPRSPVAWVVAGG